MSWSCSYPRTCSFVIDLFEFFSLEVEVLLFSSHVLHHWFDFLGEFWNDIIGIVDVIVELDHEAIVYTAEVLHERVSVAFLWKGGSHLIWGGMSGGEGLSSFVLLGLLFLKLIFNYVPFIVLLTFNSVVVLGVGLVSSLEHDSVVHVSLFSFAHGLVVVNVFFFFLLNLCLLQVVNSLILINSVVESFGVVLVWMGVVPVF